MKNVKIYSWNVNGIRAIYRKNFMPWVKKSSPDILCLQEIKAESTQLPKDLIKLNSYYPFFNSSKKKKGYSGVAVYSKYEPEKVSFGLGNKKYDQEGRTLQVEFEDFTLLNVYFPNGGQENKRVPFKLGFYNEFLKKIKNLRKAGHKVIFGGDVNTAHTEIDLARPKANEENTGFLPEERAWIDKVIENDFFDAYRYFYPDTKHMYSYWDYKTRARERNVGWRIDYFFADKSLKKRLTDATIHTSVLGSDHCPISVKLKSKIK